MNPQDAPIHPDPGARRFVTAFCAVWLAALAGGACFCFYVNPWGNYGTTGYFNLYNDRYAKTKYLESLPRESLPDVVILGASGTMRYSPDEIERLLGKKAFNFGVFWGMPEDFLCITRHLTLDRRHKPDTLIIGVDTWTFRGMANKDVLRGVERRLLNTAKLIHHLPEANLFTVNWVKFQDCFSAQQYEMAVDVLKDRRIRRRAVPGMVESGCFDRSGMRLTYPDVYGNLNTNIFELVENGQYPITEYVQARTETEGLAGFPAAGWYRFEKPSAKRVEYMRQLLRFCLEQRIRVVFVRNPLHPLFLRYLALDDRHRQNEKAFQEHMDSFQRDYPCVKGFVDASELARQEGDSEGFYDEVHPATRNCDLVIPRIVRLLAP